MLIAGLGPGLKVRKDFEFIIVAEIGIYHLVVGLVSDVPSSNPASAVLLHGHNRGATFSFWICQGQNFEL